MGGDCKAYKQRHRSYGRHSVRVRGHRINVLDRREERLHRQNETDLRRSARLTRSRVRAGEVREAETAEQR